MTTIPGGAVLRTALDVFILGPVASLALSAIPLGGEEAAAPGAASPGAPRAPQGGVCVFEGMPAPVRDGAGSGGFGEAPRRAFGEAGDGGVLLFADAGAAAPRAAAPRTGAACAPRPAGR